MEKTKKYLASVGRRKRAVARVRLFKGKGELLLNGRPIGQYFPGKVNELFYLEPFKTSNCLGDYYATIKVSGSGKASQLQAVVHGLSRALVKAEPKFKPGLKKKGLLTRDPRERQRRHVGTGGKARRKKQSPKR